METRKIGALDVSLIGLGCNNFGGRLDYDRTLAVVDAALGAGINHFDTADIYGETRSEEFLGRALAGRRDRVVLVTKFGMPVDEKRKGARPEYVRQAAEDSLRRLRTDRIDLYFLHRPDLDTPIADTLSALDELVRSGKVREIGCSAFTAGQLREARDAAGDGAKLVCVQNEYSLLHREPEVEVLAECERQGLAFVPYFPLASGALTGKYREGAAPPEGSRLAGGGRLADRFLTGPNLAVVEKLRAFAESRGHSLLELAFSWLASHPAVASVIAGATSPEQVRSNVDAAGWRLSPADLDAVDDLAPRGGD